MVEKQLILYTFVSKNTYNSTNVIVNKTNTKQYKYLVKIVIQGLYFLE